MSRKHRHEGDEVEVHVMGEDEEICITTKGLSRPISPPPLRRNVLVTPGTHLTNAKQPPVRRSLPRAYHKDRRRAIYMHVSEETELSMVTEQPDWFGLNTTQRTPASDGLNEEISRVVQKFAESSRPDAGDIITVDYIDPDSTYEDSIWGHNPQKSVIDAESDLNSAQKPPGPQNVKTSSLCDRCQRVVKESSVMNRPWRKVVKTRKEGNVWIKNMEPIKYHGQKCNIFRHHNELGALRRSARAGCHLCSLLDAYDPNTPIIYDDSSTTPYVLKVIYAANHNEGPGVLVLEARRHPTKATHLMFEQTRRMITGTLKLNETDADPVLDLGRRWLNTCLESHEACRVRSGAATGFVPTRLVKVKTLGHTIQKIHLTLGCNLPPNTPYLCLSHCWGGADIIKLTKATLEDFQLDIPTSQLPKNFEDAIIITGILGYEYIWIDSLCVTQDSPEDWKQEAAKMGSVYRNGVCTIAAVGSKDSHGGCFATRSALSFMPCQLIPWSATRPGVYAENWYRQPEPLHTRAWVVQERCLSIRTLNFGADMLSWDCISSKASEQEPEMESTTYDGSLKRTFDDLLADPPSQLQERRPDWINAWWKLVTEYSACNITFATDKWPAMKGLATEAERERGLNLVHGLWEFNLTDELLWTISKPKNTRLDIGAPSWSWLSIDGKINRRRYNYAMDFRLDAKARLLSSSPECNSEITITGRMLPLRWAFHAVDKGTTPAYHFRLLDDRPNSPKSNDWHGRWIPDTVANKNWETWSLQIVRTDEYQLKGSAGLVVEPVAGKENTFKRIGFYEIIWRDESHCDASVPRRWFGYRKKIILV